MYAITIKHPFVWAILHCGKWIENRTWKPSSLRKDAIFAIHGGRIPKQGPERREAEVARRWIVMHGLGPDVPLEDTFLPGVVGTFVYGGIVDPDIIVSPWLSRSVGNVGWHLTDVRRLVEPVPCRGENGLWRLPPEVEAKVLSTPSEPVR